MARPFFSFDVDEAKKGRAIQNAVVNGTILLKTRLYL